MWQVSLKYNIHTVVRKQIVMTMYLKCHIRTNNFITILIIIPQFRARQKTFRLLNIHYLIDKMVGFQMILLTI